MLSPTLCVSYNLLRRSHRHQDPEPARERPPRTTEPWPCSCACGRRKILRRVEKKKRSRSTLQCYPKLFGVCSSRHHFSELYLTNHRGNSVFTVFCRQRIGGNSANFVFPLDVPFAGKHKSLLYLLTFWLVTSAEGRDRR